MLVSYEKDIFSGSVAIFNGDVDDTNDDVIDDFVLSVTATPREDLSVRFFLYHRYCRRRPWDLTLRLHYR